MKRLLLLSAGALLLVGLAGAGFVYWIAFEANTPGYEEARGVKIPREASFAVALDSLEAAGVVRSRTSLEWMGRVTGWGGQVKAGYYTFEPGASNYDILSTLRGGLQSPVRVTIPPGMRPEVIAAVAARNMAFPADSFLAALRDTAFAAELGTDTTHLPGFLLPETYQFYWLNDPQAVIRRAKESYDRLYATHEARADSLGLAPADVATLASIVEWETGLPEEKARVAGVYLNRLRIGMPLQADPTVQYAVMEREGQKRRLLYVDYEIQHPYNTYNYQGLPPGPLNNPSASAIRAVLQPEDHGYLYFVATGDGGHIFSRTLREHNNAAQAYYRTMRARRDSLRRAEAAEAPDE